MKRPGVDRIRKECDCINYLLCRVWELIKVQGDHPNHLAYNLQECCPSSLWGIYSWNMTVLTAKVGNATRKLVSRAFYISYSFSLMVYIFGCRK